MDDILYLRQHAETESFLFVVDSSRRNTSVHPTPNDYEVHFHAPFTHVVGLDLVDATVPRTEYLVEAGGNSLVYTHGGTRHTATVEPGDYNILQLVAALNGVLQPRLTLSPTSTPPEISNKVAFVSSQPFTLHVPESTLAKALGLGVSSLSATARTPGTLGTRNLVSGPLPAHDTTHVHTPARQAFTAPATGNALTASLYVRSEAAATVRVAIVTPANELVATGAAATSGTAFERVTVVLATSSPLMEGHHYYLVVGSPDPVHVFTGPDPPSTASGDMLHSQWWKFASGDWSGDTGGMCLDAHMAADGYQVLPAGVVDLTGEPYILVRCPEIEQYLYRERAYETVHTGLGLVKLGNYGFREQRFDFTNFPPRNVPTPIAKLSRLTIRLEKGDGTLYDTKGVNHHLVLAIRYLEVTRGPKATTSTLYPNYQPDPLLYMQSHT